MHDRKFESHDERDAYVPRGAHEKRRLLWQEDMEKELLTESRLATREWEKQAFEAAKAYARARPKSDPFAFSEALQRMASKTFSIAAVLRMSKEGAVL